jgi:hypothetical protein
MQWIFMLFFFGVGFLEHLAKKDNEGNSPKSE